MRPAHCNWRACESWNPYCTIGDAHVCNEDPAQPIQRGGYKGWKVLVMTSIWEEGGKEERTPLGGLPAGGACGVGGQLLIQLSVGL